MSVSGWLRQRSEHYLMHAAQRDMAAKYATPQGPPARGAERFWLRVYVPAYRAVPWRLRNVVIQRMPGSHRMTWTKPTRPRGPAV